MFIWNYIATKKKLDAAEQRIRHLELDLQLTAGAHRISINERLALKDQLRNQTESNKVITNKYESQSNLLTEMIGRAHGAEDKLRTRFDLVAHIERQKAFSAKTFGPLELNREARLRGVVDHIRKECQELEQDPVDLMEWIDIIILGIDGASRAGHSSEAIVQALVVKQTKNENRKCLDWSTAAPDKAIEHVRTEEEQKAKEQEVPQTPSCPNGCGKSDPHFVGPSLGEAGFYTCQPKG